MRNDQSQILLHQHNNCFFEATMINKAKPYKNASNIRYSLDLPPKHPKAEITSFASEFQSFKDDKLRVYRQITPPTKVEKSGISLFRRQKKTKWLQLLEERPESHPAQQKQSHAIAQQKINPLTVKVEKDNQSGLASSRRSVSYRLKGENREIYTSLEKRNYSIKQKPRAASTLKFNAHQKDIILSGDRIKTKRDDVKQINFCVQTKPINGRVTTALAKRSKQEIKRMYSPSKIFRKTQKDTPEGSELLNSQLFRAWEFKQEGLLNEIETYTEDLFQRETVDMNSLKFPQKKTRSQRV